MAKNVIQSTVLFANGGVSVAPGAQITIRNSDGLLVPLWLDREGTQPTSNPFTADSAGFFRVYVDAGRYSISASKDGQVQKWSDIVTVPEVGDGPLQVPTNEMLRPLRNQVSSLAGLVDDLFSPSALYEMLADPALPLPAFVEGWAHNSFYSSSTTAPDLSAASDLPPDGMGQGGRILEYSVTGEAGSQTLTISTGNESYGGGNWGAVIRHDDGTYGLYNVTSLMGGQCTIWPNLRSAATNAPMRPKGISPSGQHYSEFGYRALARHIFATTRKSAYRSRCAARWQPQYGRREDWTRLGAIGSGQYGIALRNNFIGNAGSRAFRVLTSRNRTTLRATPVTVTPDTGLSKSFDLGGATGFLEMFVSCADITSDSGGGFYPFRVQVIVDEATLHDVLYTENDGLQRIIVPYAAADTGEVIVTFDEEGNVGQRSLYIDSVTWWSTDGIISGYPWDKSVIDKDAKTVVLGDSWTTFFPGTPGGKDGVLGRELQAAMAEAGGTGTVVSVGAGGTTAEFGLSEFEDKVAPENPQQVVICYFTNDHNQYGDDGYGRWLSAMYRLGRRCQAIGARPIFVMPLPTESLSQSLAHGNWASELGSGLLA